MKKTSFILALVLAASLSQVTPGHAQSETPKLNTPAAPLLTPEQRIEKRLAHARKKLNLTDAQVDQMRAILKDNMSKLMADRQNLRNVTPGNGAVRDAHKQLMTDRKAMMERMKGVLTPDQLEKFKKMRMEQIDRQQERLARRKKALEK